MSNAVRWGILAIVAALLLEVFAGPLSGGGGVGLALRMFGVVLLIAGIVLVIRGLVANRRTRAGERR